MSEIRLAFRDAVYMNSSQSSGRSAIWPRISRYKNCAVRLSWSITLRDHSTTTIDSVDLLQHDQKNQRTRTTVALQSWLEERRWS